MKIRSAEELDRQALIRVIDRFRMALAELRSKPAVSNLKAGAAELEEYIAKKFPIYVAEDEQAGIVGYMVCRVDLDVLWVESVYVEENFRRKGIASSLYMEAERIAGELGQSTPYNWVDPNNEAMIDFLRKRGYDVLNLIELRRRGTDEDLVHKVRVGEQEFYRR